MRNFKRTKFAYYSANIYMSVVSCLSPLLFSTFHSTYGISYSLLGTLVLINFCTQRLGNVLFSFYSYKFNLTTVVRIMPALTGFCTAIFWLGSLIMVAGGDLGASLAPQLVGVITDGTLASPTAGKLASRLGLGVEQFAMKTGLVFASIFPLVAVLCFSLMPRRHKRIENRKNICIGEESI